MFAMKADRHRHNRQNITNFCLSESAKRCTKNCELVIGFLFEDVYFITKIQHNDHYSDLIIIHHLKITGFFNFYQTELTSAS